MKFAFVGHAAAQEEGTPAGRQLYAIGTALLAAGHDVTAWSWRAQPPAGPVAPWCEWRPLPRAAAWRVRARALAHPRGDIVRARWRPPADAIVVADDPASWPAVAGTDRGVATVHYSVGADRRALRDWSGPHVQDWRAERSAARRAPLVWTLSERVREAIGIGVVVPACVPVPTEALPLVDAPVAALVADWSWPANRAAVRTLLDAWPEVRDRVPGSRLVLAGRGPAPAGTGGGVEWRGQVPTVTDVLAGAAVLAFPCPPTSGPKMKVLEAMAHGVAVVTTAAGVEGISGGAAAAAVADRAGWVDTLVDVLSDPVRRAGLAHAGRDVVLRAHTPAYAAAQRITAARRRWPDAATE